MQTRGTSRDFHLHSRGINFTDSFTLINKHFNKVGLWIP